MAASRGERGDVVGTQPVQPKLGRDQIGQQLRDRSSGHHHECEVALEPQQRRKCLERQFIGVFDVVDDEHSDVGGADAVGQWRGAGGGVGVGEHL